MEMINYETLEREETPFAKRLALWIAQVLEPVSVLDIGCGPGMHVRELNALNVNAKGIDSDPRVVGLSNLNQVSVFDNKDSADLVLCLEMAEHIDAQYQVDIVKAVSKATERYLIWTAAVPGQGGVGHINCRPVHFWETLFAEQGMHRNNVVERSLRMYIREGYHMGWFANNLLFLEWQ